MKVEDLRALRSYLLSSADPRAAAGAVAGDPRQPAAARAVAALVKAQLGYYAHPRDGRRALKSAIATLRDYAEVNRKAAPLLRDAFVIAGLFHARHGRWAEAKEAYHEALVGERDPTRRSLVHSNLVKLHLARGELYDAASWARKAPVEGVERDDVRDALTLARARILLTLGCNGAAEAVIRDVRLKKLAPFPNLLEHRYLGLAARVRQPFNAAAFERRLDDFATWVAEAAPGPASQAFYELEVWIFRRCLLSARIKNRRHTEERVRHLAKTAGAAAFQKLYFAADACLAGGGRGITALEEALAGTVAAASHLTFQLASLLLARSLIELGHRQAAGRLLGRLEQHWRMLESSFPPRTLAKLAKGESQPRSLAAALSIVAPDPEASAQDSWLLGS